MYVETYTSAAAPTSSPVQTARERVWLPTTSSMITLVISGTRAITAIPASDEPSDRSTLRRYRQA